jgi:hypothetical protein
MPSSTGLIVITMEKKATHRPYTAVILLLHSLNYYNYLVTIVYIFENLLLQQISEPYILSNITVFPTSELLMATMFVLLMA